MRAMVAAAGDPQDADVARALEKAACTGLGVFFHCHKSSDSCESNTWQ